MIVLILLVIILFLRKGMVTNAEVGEDGNIPIINPFRSLTIVVRGTSYTMVDKVCGVFLDTTDLCLLADPDVCNRWLHLFGFAKLRIRVLEETRKEISFWVSKRQAVVIIGYIRAQITAACKAGDMKRFVPHK